MYAWVWTKNFSNGWHKPFSRIHLGIEKFTQWKSHKSKEQMCRRKQGRMGERPKAPGSRKSSVENSGTRVCAWVRIPLLSENILKTIRQSLQLTNSVILERQFKTTAQSKRKQKTRYVIRGWKPSVSKVHKKEDTQQRHVQHEYMRGFERKTFQMDDTNRLAEYISELKNLPNGKATNQKNKCVDGNKAEWASDLRRLAQEIPQSRVLVHECLRGFESQTCQKTFWKRSGRAFSWQILSYWNVNSRRQPKAKENKRLATSSVVESRAFQKCTKKKIPSKDMCNTNVCVGLNEKLFKWMTQTV